MNDYDRQDLIKQRTGSEPPAHEGDYWSDEDRARLKCLFDMGFGISEIALELRRGEPAICQQIAHMDLFERKRRRHRVRPALPSGSLHHPTAAKSSKGGRVMFEDYPDILSPEEAAEALRIGENAIYKLLNEGKLKAYKNGRTWRVPKEAVKEYVIALSKITQSCS